MRYARHVNYTLHSVILHGSFISLLWGTVDCPPCPRLPNWTGLDWRLPEPRCLSPLSACACLSVCDATRALQLALKMSTYSSLRDSWQPKLAPQSGARVSQFHRNLKTSTGQLVTQLQVGGLGSGRARSYLVCDLQYLWVGGTDAEAAGLPL